MDRVTGAIFLDRDGTINRRPVEHSYVTNVRDLELLPEAVSGMVRLARVGWPLIVVSNQRGIALGKLTRVELVAIEECLQSALAMRGQSITAFYYCPHDLDEKCDCRKPKPGMLLAAARDYELDLSASWIVGDTEADMEAGAAAGCRRIRLGRDAPSLYVAADMILGTGGGGRGAK